MIVQDYRGSESVKQGAIKYYDISLLPPLQPQTIVTLGITIWSGYGFFHTTKYHTKYASTDTQETMCVCVKTEEKIATIR